MKNKTNILFITSDQQHYSAMGYLNPELKTPNLDKLVKEGTTFHRAYTVNPTCTPTRASWITGLYPSQHGAYSLGTKLMENIPTVGSIFSQNGYKTALIGKAHFQPLKSTPEYPSIEAYPILHDLDFWKKFHGPFYGFEHVELARNHTNESHVGQHYALWMIEKGYNNWRDYFLPTPDFFKSPEDKYPYSTHKNPKPGEAWEIPEEIHYNTWIAERTNALMEEYKKNNSPFFIWASFFDPHPQYMVPEPYASMYDPTKISVPEHKPGEFDDKPPYFSLSQIENPDFSDFYEEEGNGIHGAGSHLRSKEIKAKNIATMYGMMTMLDKYIGKILDKLDELGLSENTLVCYTTDHGDFLGQHGLVAKAIHHYEDLLKVPLVVKMPGTIPEGKISNSLQSTLDLPQTFLSFAKLPIPRNMTGIDEKSVWNGEVENIRKYVMIENQHQPTKLNIRTYIDQRYKVTVYYDKEYGEIYDLLEDPFEYKNLWNSSHKDLKIQLLQKFISAEMAKAPRPMPRIAGA
ncbi:MAG TPA: sulfatase-like hydrolase/transferase [Victivallales bacterium]|nr:sulfatase-like hydrolase/transferase [Victivallales bacterium]HRR27911.1 sulfatase-like hydrolase/transferase [Victivallales bacterium]